MIQILFKDPSVLECSGHTEISASWKALCAQEHYEIRLVITEGLVCPTTPSVPLMENNNPQGEVGPDPAVPKPDKELRQTSRR